MKPYPRRRDCEHDHGFPLCACHEGAEGWQLLDRARFYSSLAGWPSPTLDEEYVARHQAAVAEAFAAQANPAKPRVPLGVDQRQLPPPGCKTC